MSLRDLSTRMDPAMGAPPSSRRLGRGRPIPRGLRPLPPHVRRFDPNLGGFFDSIKDAVVSAATTAYDTTKQSILIPTNTVQAVVSGNFSKVPSLLKQGAATVPLVGAAFGGGYGGSAYHAPGTSSPAPAPAPVAEATGYTGAGLQDPAAAAAAATQGLTPGTPQYAAALQAAGLAPQAPQSNLGLYIGGAGVLLAAVLLLRRRGPQT